MDGALAADSKPTWNFSGLSVFTDFIPHPFDHRSEGVWSVSVTTTTTMMFGQDLLLSPECVQVGGFRTDSLCFAGDVIVSLTARWQWRMAGWKDARTEQRLSVLL